MRAYESIVVVGSSGVGKTTMVNGVRGPEYAAALFIPGRYVTRPPRSDDDPRENVYVDRDYFEAGVDCGAIYPHWRRALDIGNKTECYGFEKVSDDDNRLRIYSANSAFLRAGNESVKAVLVNALPVMAFAMHEERARRLQERSPDMAAIERRIRLQDTSVDMIALPERWESIATTDLSPAESQEAFRQIVGQVLLARSVQP